MLELKDTKRGTLVWWTAERMMKEWSCPAIVTKVDRKKDCFRVISLDDFKETDGLRLRDAPNGDQSSRHEMRLMTVEDLEEYFADIEKDLLREIANLEAGLEAAKRELKRTTSRNKKFLESRMS